MVKVHESFAKRLRSAMQKAGMRATDLHNKTGIGKPSISAYLRGDYEPKQDKLYLIAEALNVTPSYLIGITPPEVRVDNLTVIERYHIDLFRDLTLEQQRFVNQLMEAMIMKNDLNLEAMSTEERGRYRKEREEGKKRYQDFYVAENHTEDGMPEKPEL